VVGMRFATDLRHQFEELAEGTSRSRGSLVTGGPASARRHRWLAVAAVTAVAATAAAILVFAHQGDRPQRQVVADSRAAMGKLPPPASAVGVVIWALTIDGAGRPWLSGDRGDGRQPFVAYLDAGRWVQVPAPAGAETLRSIAVFSADDLWAPVAGGFVHWDGAAWHKSPVPWLDGNEAGIEDMAALSTADIWAVGHEKGKLFKTPGDGPGEYTQGSRPLTMHWDGTAWRKVTVPAMPARDSSLDAVSSRDGETWAVGGREQKTGEQAQQSGPPIELMHASPTALRWDGDRWVAMSLPEPGARGAALGDVLVLAQDDVWVLGWAYAGDESAAHDETVSTYVAHWDGVGWERIPTPRGSAWGSFSSITGSGDADIWLGGTGDGVGYAETAHWDGTQWTVYSPAQFGEDSGAAGGTGIPEIVSSSPTNVWFDAGFTRCWADDSRPPDPVLYRWDGRGWTKVDVPF